MQRWFMIKQELPSKNYREIRLDDIVHNTKHTLLDICTFTGLSFEDKMLSVDLSKSHSGRWKTDFSEQEKQLLNDSLADILTILHY